MKEITFEHSLLADTYEEQANKQGYTFGDRAECVEKVGYGLKYLYVQGCFSPSVYTDAINKFNALMIKYLKPLDEESEGKE